MLTPDFKEVRNLRNPMFNKDDLILKMHEYFFKGFVRKQTKNTPLFHSLVVQQGKYTKTN